MKMPPIRRESFCSGSRSHARLIIDLRLPIPIFCGE